MNAGIILKEKKYMERGANFFKPANYRKIVSSRQGFEIIGGEVGEIIKEIITHKGKNYLKPFIKENKALIKDNIRDMFDIAIGYDLGNFLALLIENKLLNKDHSIPTSEIAIASKPLNFTEAQFVKDNLMGNTQEYGTIGCNFKAKSGAEFTFFYDKDNATISSSNWKQNKGKDDRFDCKSESNDVNNCPFRFIKNN